MFYNILVVESSKNKNYYLELDIIRILSCIAILLYHMNILQGGYLAVCIFFVMTSYLSCLSSFKKEKFSFKDYYLNRFKKVYLPLLIVVLLSLAFFSLFKDMNWFNLKPESQSVLLGYNNYWQLSVNSDYFARHVSSPFIHFWFMGILLQFEVVFPLLFYTLKKIGDKVKCLPIIILSILSCISTAFFVYNGFANNIMNVYYDTLSRSFSLIYGLLIGFIHNYYRPLVFNKFNTKFFKIAISSIYFIVLILMFLFIKSDSEYFIYAMIITSIISIRLIDYSKLTIVNKSKSISYISNLTYYIYLVQYPVIYALSLFELNNNLNNIIIIALVILLSIILDLVINKKESIVLRIFRYIFGIMIIIISLYGLYIFVISKDYTEEMKELERQINQNEEYMKLRQEEYKMNAESKEEDLKASLDNLDSEEELKKKISSLNVVGIGDSVMLGAVPKLYETFKNGYFDAGISRTAWVAMDILNSLKRKNMLGDIVVFNLGANGDCSSCRDEILKICGNRKIFWVTVTNDYSVRVNDRYKQMAKSNDNVYIIDWEKISKGHKDYFISDGIHLTSIGREAYSKAIFDSIYKVYLDKINKEKEQILNNYNNELNKRITFYGNDLLTNIYNKLNNISLSNEKTNSNYTFDLLLSDMKLDKENNELNKNIVFLFDKNTTITKDNYEKIISIYNDNNIYIVKINDEDLSILEKDNVHVINFYNELLNHKEYYMPDKIHLSNIGNDALSKIIIDVFNNENKDNKFN